MDTIFAMCYYAVIYLLVSHEGVKIFPIGRLTLFSYTGVTVWTWSVFAFRYHGTKQQLKLQTESEEKMS